MTATRTKSFGMKQRPDGDIEIDEKFWEEEYHIPSCQKCNGILKPYVVFFGDNVPKGRADRAMEAAKECDAFLALGSSLMTMSAFRMIKIYTSEALNKALTAAKDQPRRALLRRIPTIPLQLIHQRR